MRNLEFKARLADSAAALKRARELGCDLYGDLRQTDTYFRVPSGRLKLRETADVGDLKPFRFTLPGTVPSIPLRMTSLAAEPEMSIVVWVLSDQRYEAKNWMNAEVDPADIRMVAGTSPMKTNWTRLVAQAVDVAGGQAWVTEFAGSTDVFIDPIETQIASGTFATAEDEQAARALLLQDRDLQRREQRGGEDRQVAVDAEQAQQVLDVHGGEGVRPGRAGAGRAGGVS